MYSIEMKDGDVTRMLKRLAKKSDDLTPAMREIGEYLIESTKQRFVKGEVPDGRPWEKNTQTTLDMLLYHRKGGSTRRKGEDVGGGASTGKKPLIGESKRLGNEIHAKPTSTRISVGSSLIYSAVQQFGAKKGAFGSTSKGHPIPWGTISARPYLGISDNDRVNVMDIIAEHLEEAMK